MVLHYGDLYYNKLYPILSLTLSIIARSASEVEYVEEVQAASMTRKQHTLHDESSSITSRMPVAQKKKLRSIN